MEDRLSSLPDEIITKILVHLNTKEVFRTRILSKHWKSAWESVPVIEICNSDFKHKGEHVVGLSSIAQQVRARFSNFVDGILVARKSPRLDKFSITSDGCVDVTVMRSWMRAAIDRRVTELVFEFREPWVYLPSELTPAMFASDYLRVLKLRTFMRLYIPTSASSFLPNLKFLELCDVSYRDDMSLPNLLSGCPNLEDLRIVRPRWKDTVTLDISSMRTLYIKSRSLKTLLVESTVEGPKTEVKIILIDTPALESIDISCQTRKKFVARDLPCLVEAILDLSGLPRTPLHMFLTRISHVKYLTLKSETTLSLVLAGSGIMPMFPNLTHLNLYGVYRGSDRESRSHTEWAAMLEILESSPKLETLIILQNHSCSFWEYNGNLEDWDVPDCLVSRLKTLEIDFDGISRYDVRKMEYLLTNAQALKMMTVRAGSFPVTRSVFASFHHLLSPEFRNSVIWSDKQFIVPFPESNLSTHLF